MSKQLQQTIKDIAIPGKGILAADESTNSAGKRLAAINVESTEETRRQYRNLILTAPGIEKYISGVILFEETLHQKTDDGALFPDHLRNIGIVPGIKVDKGLEELNEDGDEFTKGLDDLDDRLKEYKKSGPRFAKWRAVFTISDKTPSPEVIKRNTTDLARYAKICQENDIVPIVEPEVFIDGDHTIEKSNDVISKVLIELYRALKKENVALEFTILKPSMITSGDKSKTPAGIDEVAKLTIKSLKETVPEEVPSINFLSGGLTPEESTSHLNRMHTIGEKLPWNLSFSYARALQGPALKVWLGKKENLEEAQKTFIKRCKLNSLAVQGKYTPDMEN